MCEGSLTGQGWFDGKPLPLRSSPRASWRGINTQPKNCLILKLGEKERAFSSVNDSELFESEYTERERKLYFEKLNILIVIMHFCFIWPKTLMSKLK